MSQHLQLSVHKRCSGVGQTCERSHPYSWPRQLSSGASIDRRQALLASERARRRCGVEGDGTKSETYHRPLAARPRAQSVTPRRKRNLQSRETSKHQSSAADWSAIRRLERGRKCGRSLVTRSNAIGCCQSGGGGGVGDGALTAEPQV